MDITIQSAAVLGLICFSLVGCDQGASSSLGDVPAGAQPKDANMTCQQIVPEISRQNARIKLANLQSKQTGQTSMLSSKDTNTPEINANSGSSSLVPGVQQEMPQQLEADRVGADATARANALVDLGRQKKCFQ